MFILQKFYDNFLSIPWGEAVLFGEPQVCGQAQVVSAGTGLICGLFLCSELEDMMDDSSDQSYSHTYITNALALRSS